MEDIPEYARDLYREINLRVKLIEALDKAIDAAPPCGVLWREATTDNLCKWAAELGYLTDELRELMDRAAKNDQAAVRDDP